MFNSVKPLTVVEMGAILYGWLQNEHSELYAKVINEFTLSSIELLVEQFIYKVVVYEFNMNDEKCDKIINTVVKNKVLRRYDHTCI